MAIYLIAIYSLVCVALLKLVRNSVAMPLFAVVNLLAAFFAFYLNYPLQVAVLRYGLLIACVGVCQGVISYYCVNRSTFAFWLAFLLPVAMLAVQKSSPAIVVLGASYMAFRISYLVAEINSGKVNPPSFWNFWGFCFFFPTIFMGPISPFQTYLSSLDKPKQGRDHALACLVRISIGLIKYALVGVLFLQLTLKNFEHEGYVLPVTEFVVGVFAYYLYLYANFSGFCDIVIGVSGLMGFEVKENFRSPLLARNIQDFWQRWHISLTDYFRDVFYNPLLTTSVRKFGAAAIPVLVLLLSVASFVMIGVWHGVGWNYVVFGVLHGLAVWLHYLYRGFLKRFGRDALKSYNSNWLVRCLSTATTFCFVGFSLLLIDNSLEDIKRILGSLYFP